MLIYQENSILQQREGFEKEWTVPDLLQTYNPLPGEPLPHRNEAMKHILPMAEMIYEDLSRQALLTYQFWKQIQLQRIEEHTYTYSLKISKNYHWKLILNSEGIFYHDLTPLYGQIPGQVFEQLFSDFWFYGPLVPIPDLKTRKWLIAHIRNAFIQAGSVDYDHFELFDYPTLPIDRHWQEGDANRQSFVNLRPFGIEYGEQNWRDGLVYSGFFSFEHFLTRPQTVAKQISPEIRTEIEKFLSPRNGAVKSQESHSDPTAEMKKIFMENGGIRHYIYRDHGDSYHPSSADESLWREELIQQYTEKLGTTDNKTSLRFITEALVYHQVEKVDDILFEVARAASPKARQAIWEVLNEFFPESTHEEILISLLQFAEQDSYWRDFVFHAFFKMHGNRGVQHFLVECLKGNDETRFNKAVDVLRMWGIYGDQALMDRDLLNRLNWEGARSGEEDFQRSLERVIQLFDGA